MAEVAGAPDMPTENPPINHGCAADAGAESQEHDIRGVARRAEPNLTEQGGLGIVEDWDGGIELEPFLPVQTDPLRLVGATTSC